MNRLTRTNRAPVRAEPVRTVLVYAEPARTVLVEGPRDGRRHAHQGLRGSERGSASVLAVGLVAGLAMLLVTALVLVSVLVAGQKARAGADLAALAAAGAVVEGGEESAACAVADRVARDNGSELAGCGLQEHAGQPWPAVTVTVSREVVNTPWTVTARAVAGSVPAKQP